MADAVNPGDEIPTVAWYMSFNLFLVYKHVKFMWITNHVKVSNFESYNFILPGDAEEQSNCRNADNQRQYGCGCHFLKPIQKKYHNEKNKKERARSIKNVEDFLYGFHNLPDSDDLPRCCIEVDRYGFGHLSRNQLR